MLECVASNKKLWRKTSQWTPMESAQRHHVGGSAIMDFNCLVLESCLSRGEGHELWCESSEEGEQAALGYDSIYKGVRISHEATQK